MQTIKLYNYHLKKGTLVLIGGTIPGVIIERLDGFYYNVFATGKVHKVHRDDMIENDDENL